jgi:hypothetical protein
VKGVKKEIKRKIKMGKQLAKEERMLRDEYHALLKTSEKTMMERSMGNRKTEK